MRRPAVIALALTALAVPAAVPAQGPDDPSQDDAYTLPEGLPALGRSAIVQVQEGRVLVRTPGSGRYRRLDGRRLEVVPMGSFLDARRGRLRVTVQARRGSERTVSASFFDGKFQITQETESPYVTDLRLVGGFASCREASASAEAAAKRKKRKRVRGLWGDGKGRFRTSGRYSAATVRGTRWLVEDRCDGTLTRVARGEVEVEDYSAAGDDGQNTPMGGGEDQAEQAPVAAPQERRGTRTVRVRRGGSYVARP